MVKNPRTQTGTGTSHRPLNMPIPVTVQTDQEESPAATDALRRRHTTAERRTDYKRRHALRTERPLPQSDSALVKVASIIDMWEICDEWWRKTPIKRRYWKVKLESGHDLTLFQDMENGKWFQQDY